MTSENWQLRCAELKQRGAYLYRSKLWSDCTFQLVGPPGDDFDVTIKAHKLIMAMASPVFSKMLYESFVKFPVPIYAVRPEVFNILLEYIYTDDLNITSSKVACDLYHAAKKWKLPHVAKCCTIYLNEHMSPANICHIYKLACDSEDILLQQTCEKVFSAKTKEILKDDSFYEADLCIVKRFFSLDPLNIDSELDLFEAAVNYVTIQEGKTKARNALRKTDEENSEEEPPSKKVRRASITPNDESNNVSDLEESPSNASEFSDDEAPRKMGTPTKDDVANVKDKMKYRELIANIRFLSLSPQQLATCTCLTALLTDAELLAIAMNVASQETTYEVPKGLSTCMVPRTLYTKEDRIRQSASFRSVIHNFKNIQKHESTYFYLRNLAWSLMVLSHNESYVLAVTCFFESGPPEWVKNTRVKVRFSTRRPMPKHLHKIALKLRTPTPEHGAWLVKMNREDLLNPDYGFVDDLNTVSYKLYINTVPKQDESGELDEFADTTLNSIDDDLSKVALRRSKTPALDTSKNSSTIIATTAQITTQSRSPLDTIITTRPRPLANVNASQKSSQSSNATTIQSQSRPFATVTTAQSRSSLSVTLVQTKSLSSATVTTIQSLTKPSTLVSNSQSQLLSSPSETTDLSQPRLSMSTNLATAQLQTKSSTLTTIQPQTRSSSTVGTGQSKTLSSPRAITDQSQLLSSPILTTGHTQSLTATAQLQTKTSTLTTIRSQTRSSSTVGTGQSKTLSSPRATKLLSSPILTTGHIQSLTSPRVTISEPQSLTSPKLNTGKLQSLPPPKATTGQVQSVSTSRVTSVSLPQSQLFSKLVSSQSQKLSSHKMTTGQLHLSPNLAAVHSRLTSNLPAATSTTTISSPRITSGQLQAHPSPNVAANHSRSRPSSIRTTVQSQSSSKTLNQSKPVPNKATISESMARASFFSSALSPSGFGCLSRLGLPPTKTSSGVIDPAQSKISSTVITTSLTNSKPQLSELAKKSPSPHFSIETSGSPVSTHPQTVHNIPPQQSSLEPEDSKTTLQSMTQPQPKIEFCTSSTANSSSSTLQTISTRQTDLKTADTPSTPSDFYGIFKLSEDSLNFTVASPTPSPLHAVTVPWPTKPANTITNNTVGFLQSNTQCSKQSKSTISLECEKGSYEDNLFKPLTETNFKIKEINLKTESKEVAVEKNESVSQLKSLQEIAFTQLKMLDKKQNKNKTKKTRNTKNIQTILPKSLKDMTLFMLKSLIKNEENSIVSYQKNRAYNENKIYRVIDKESKKAKMLETKTTPAILPKSLKNIALSELQKIITTQLPHIEEMKHTMKMSYLE